MPAPKAKKQPGKPVRQKYELATTGKLPGGKPKANVPGKK